MATEAGPRVAGLTGPERVFVEGVATHYHEAHGVTWEKASVMGWMIISDPPEQSVSQICATLDVKPDHIEQLIEQLTLAELYEVVERPGEETAYRLAEDGYAKVVAHTFASWPDYLEIFRFGLEVLSGATPQRRRRVVEIVELFGSIVPDLADMSRRWNETVKGIPVPEVRTTSAQTAAPAPVLSKQTATTGPTGDEWTFVERIAEYYFINDGMPHDRGRVVGWLMICDPPEKKASQIVAELGVSRAEVDRIVDQLTPENDPVSVFERRGALDEDYALWLRENSWGPKVKGIFTEFADFHRVAAEGLETMRDASDERLGRLRNMELFLRFVSTEMPKILQRHEERMAAKP